MDGDNGRKKKFDRNIELEYNHDWHEDDSSLSIISS